MSENLTPMMSQYRRIKNELQPGVLLFFRLGDFYEMFFEDAKEASAILDIALTKRNEVPMCGIPYHAADSYLAKLLRAGKKVAICDQMEDASLAKGIVKREVERIVTPGTAIGEDVLEAGKNNFIISMFKHDDTVGIACMDISTGAFWAEEAANSGHISDMLGRISPSECLVPSGQIKDPVICDAIQYGYKDRITEAEDWTFQYETSSDFMVRHFNVHSLEGFGCQGNRAVVGAAGGLLYYVKESLRRKTDHVRSFQLRQGKDFMIMDETTCMNLNVLSSAGGDQSASLYAILNASKTAMGARKLRQWLLRPLCRQDQIMQRLTAVETFYKDRTLLAKVREVMSEIRDMERMVGRIGSGSGNARDIRAIGLSMKCLPSLKKLLEAHKSGLLGETNKRIKTFPDLTDLIDKAIVDEPPIPLKEGGLIKQGYNKELDELRGIATSGKNWLAEYQTKEQARTGIKTLKVRYNSVFGYYIEISKGQIENAPADYIRKQTLVNAERFITPELKEYEDKIVGAQDKANVLEYEIFLEVKSAVAAEIQGIQEAADAVACIDVLCAFADRAVALRYVKPVITDKDELVIKDGRHPIVEQMPDAERFVANDTVLDCTQNQLIIITGPNMAGKSTYIRQVGLIAVMAHVGSFVPASEATISLIDRVFTRVGASDDLARGRSTFMVEMQETANILNNATGRSLIVLDEIGRGTSTFDGISIAWAVAEHLHNNVKAKTLFATHYHELTDLALTMSGIKNYNVLIRESGDKIAFLRKIVAGAADKSYGIQVARLAGLPLEVIERSKEILANLEEGEISEAGQPKLAKTRRPSKSSNQMRLFE